MKVLLLGASGFIGREVLSLLRLAGHEVCAPSRQEIDFCALSAKAKDFLQGQEAVINCVGLMSCDQDLLEDVHHHAPLQLAHWAHEQGVRRWVQLSALGADENQRIAFVGSKGRGDAAIAASAIQSLIARPSLVYGRQGKSTRIFRRLAALPIWFLPNRGQYRVQPVHVKDVAQGLLAMLDAELANASVVAMTGAQRLSLADYLQVLRQHGRWQKPAKIVRFPDWLLQAVLWLGKGLSHGFLSQDNLDLLAQGACADHQDFSALLGREPLGVADFLAADAFDDER